MVVFSPCTSDSVGLIHSIGVIPTEQNRGIGTDLKKHALDVCTKAGASSVTSQVHRNNGKMRRVNEKLGIAFTLDPDNGKFYLYAAPIVPDPNG